jgi:dipeptidyl aminopeptidase/acylaminoacyl peptidase
MFSNGYSRGALFAGIGFVFVASGVAQQARQYTKDDYAKAERFMAYNVTPLSSSGLVRAKWLDDGRFWYRETNAGGWDFTLVDPLKKTKATAFDEVKLAKALKAAADGQMRGDERHLGITDFTFGKQDTDVQVSLGSREYKCDLSGTGVCTALKAAGPNVSVSPDKTKAAFIKDFNLWVRDLATGTEKPLTTDGVKDYGYATDNAGWKQSNNPILVWSPDSKKIATFQQDQRQVGEMYLVPVTNGHPTLKAWKYPLVGDANVTMIERVIIDVDAAKVVRMKMPPDQHRSTLCDDLVCRGSAWEDVQWNGDSNHLAFVSTSRDHKQEWLRLTDAETGAVREVMSETVPKFFESGNGKINWKYLPKSNEVLWFSERDNWGQLYLYDLTTGQLKNQITTGDGNVTQVLYVDEAARTIYFLAVGKEQGRDPYFQHFYKVGFDGKGMQLLTPENADHAVKVSNDGQYFVDTYSTPTQPQIAIVRDAKGKLAMDVAKQDISKLLATGWTPPTPFTVKARDGKTDLYGLMFKPTNFDATKKYPIVNYVYPGPQTGSCGGRSFSPGHGDLQPLAELGFVVVCIDGMGTPWRSKSFHEAYYADLGDNTIPDQVAGMKELAARYPWIDLDRVGMYGHSGGGNATGAALFHYPDFFKVGISESGNHDNRDYEDDWAEKWAGLLVKNADGTSNYDSQANQKTAKDLKGHLLLAHGTMDENVPPNNTLLVVDALIKANKDFDLIIIPNAGHGYGQATQYMTRRRWDYFVRYLGGGVPPVEYEMKPAGRAMEALGMGPEDEGYDPEIFW